MDRVSIIFSKSVICLDDFVVDVADMWAGSLFENVVDSDMIGNVVDSGMIGNLVDFGENWVDETEQDIDVKMVS